jgi:hypothetical protein
LPGGFREKPRLSSIGLSYSITRFGKPPKHFSVFLLISNAPSTLFLGYLCSYNYKTIPNIENRRIEGEEDTGL